MKTNHIFFLFAAAILFGSSSTAMAIVLSPLNGSFELPPAAPGRTSGAVTFWSDNSTIAPTYVGAQTRDDASNLLYADPTHGVRDLALEATFGGANGGVQQDLGTMAMGERYTLFADMLSFNEALPFTQILNYTLAFYNVTDSTLLSSITQADFPLPVNTTSVTPVRMTYTALASDNGDVLRLVLAPGVTTGSEYSRAGIDNVFVVPEPGTFAMMLFAAAGLCQFGLRRRNVSSTSTARFATFFAATLPDAAGQGTISGPHQATITGFDGKPFQDGPMTNLNGKSLFAPHRLEFDLLKELSTRAF